MAEQTERIAVLLDLEKAKFERNAKSAGAAIDRLERKFNPLAAAELKLQKQQERLNAALDAGTITAKRHATGMDLLQREYDQTVAKVNGARNAVVAMNSTSQVQTGFIERNRFAFQQAGYQVGDFAVQVQGGTSAITAFTQQGSQMLGVFGAYGAIAGAVLAVGAPLIASFLRSSESAEEFKTRAETLAEAVRAYSEAAKAAQIPTAELEKRYGSASEAAKVFAIALININKAIALEGLSAAQAVDAIDVGRLRQLIEFLDSVPEDSRFFSTKFRQSISDLQEEFGTTEVQARALLSAIDAFAVADGPAQVAASGKELLSTITDIFGPLEGLTGEALKLAIQVQDVSDRAAELVGVIESSTTSMLDFVKAAYESGTAIASAFPNADTMLVKLRAMAAAAWDYAGGLGASALKSGRGDPRKFGDPSLQGDRYGFRRQLREQADWEPPKSARGGGGRGGGREQQPLFSITDQEIEKLQLQLELLGKTKGEIAAITVKQKLLDEAKKRGIAITDELLAKIDAEAANVGRLAEEYDAARDKIAAMEKIQGDFKNSVIDAAMGGKDAMEQFTNSIKRAALEYLLFGEGMFAGGKKGGGLLGGLFSGGKGGGLFSGILGGVFGGARATGGPVSSGKSYLVGERGPELFTPSGSGMISPNRSAGNSASNVHVTVGVSADSNGNLAPFVEKVSQRNATRASAQAVQTVKSSLPGWQSQLQQDATL